MLIKGNFETKILMLCYEYPPIGGGGAKVVDGLTYELSKIGYKIDLVTMGFKNLPTLEEKRNLNIYRAKCLRLKKDICTFPEMITYIFSALPLILRLCKKNNYKIIHAHFIFPDGLLAYLSSQLTHTDYIITAHGSDVPGYNPNRFKIMHKLLKPIWHRVVNSSKKIIFPSSSLEALFRRINTHAPGIFIPNAIDLNKFSPNKKKEKKILIVTRMFERKGVQYILRALYELDYNYSVNIVGDGPYLDTLKSIALNLGLKVNFLGFIDNSSNKLKTLFEESEIFIFTSISENFPIVLLEAMVAGLAIITTKNTGCEEVVGDSAILIKSEDPSAIRDSLLKLFNNRSLILKLQKAARRRVEECFSWTAIAKKYANLYKNF